MEKIRLGRMIISLSHLIKRRIDESEGPQKAQRITGTNGWIIGFLARNSAKEIFQKDVERELSITRSTASRILSLMEEKGLLVRLPVEHDARLKRLQLTEEALLIHEEVHKDINRVESTIMKGFSEEEIGIFLNYLDRVRKNLEEN